MFNLHSAPLSYNDAHYYHSREFRSNIVDEKAYWSQVGKPPFIDPVAMRVLVHGFGCSARAGAGRGEAPTEARQRAANTAGARYSSDECGLASL